MDGSRVITAKSRAAEVQRAINCSAVQWSRFLIITTEAGDELINRSDTVKFSRWREVPADLQQKLIDDVKKRLAKEGISGSDDNSESDPLQKAIQWRMTQVIKIKLASSRSDGKQPAASTLDGGDEEAG